MIKEPPAMIYKVACVMWLTLCAGTGMLISGGVEYIKEQAAREAKYAVLISLPLNTLQKIDVRDL